MKIYLVTNFEQYDGVTIYAMFSNEEKAKEYIAHPETQKIYHELEIDEWETGDDHSYHKVWFASLQLNPITYGVHERIEFIPENKVYSVYSSESSICTSSTISPNDATIKILQKYRELYPTQSITIGGYGICLICRKIVKENILLKSACEACRDTSAV